MPDPSREQEHRAEAERLAQLPVEDPSRDLFRQEAERLAKLSARERREALAVHRRIADDARLCQATRDHARYVADTLQELVEGMLRKARRKSLRSS